MEINKENLKKDFEFLLDSKKGYLYAGYPRFMRLFGRDSLIASWQLLDVNPEICRATLEILSELQGKKFDLLSEEEPGKIVHETDLEFAHHPEHPNLPVPYYGSVDSTPLFIIVFWLYFNKTKDADFLKKHIKNIERAAQWIENKIKEGPGGFICYKKKQDEVQLFHKGWKDGFKDHLNIQPPVAMVEVQGYAYRALYDASALMGDLPRLIETAESLKKRFNDAFWMPEERYFALAIDGNGYQRKAVTSNPGHLLFAGILEKNRTDAVVERLFEPDMWTDYGARTHSTKEPDFDYKGYHTGSIWPHDNWIIAQGCEEKEYLENYQKIRSAILNAYQKLEGIPELYAVNIDGGLEKIPTACTIQAWALGAVLEFIK